jgi:hypothetical protein
MFRYVDNAFVINDPKYIRRDNDGTFKLTPYAVKNPQECTLLFEYTVSVTGDHEKLPASMIGFLRESKRSIRNYHAITQTYRMTQFTILQRQENKRNRKHSRTSVRNSGGLWLQNKP